MNRQKAREYFSAYLEGELDRGLAETFERAMRRDTELAGEYAAFAKLREDFERLRAQAAEPPSDLHERISRRLDRSIFDATPARSIGRLWQSLAWGLGVTILLVGAIAAFDSSGPTYSAGFSGFGSPQEPHITVTGSEAILNYAPREPAELSIRRGRDGVAIQRFRLAGRPLRSPLVNRSERAVVAYIESADGSMTVAIPGTSPSSRAVGKGNLEELLTALADYYRAPAATLEKDFDQVYSWKLVGRAPAEAGAAIVDGNLRVQVQPDGLLRVTRQ